MGRAPCCDKANVKKGPWSPEEDAKLKEYIDKYGIGGNWIALPQKVGLKRCGKSCRLRWLNYLRPNIKHGEFSDEEDRIICTLFSNIGSRWSIIAAQLPGRTDNDIKNYWNTKLKKKLMSFVHNSNITSYPNNTMHQRNKFLFSNNIPPLVQTSSDHHYDQTVFQSSTLSALSTTFSPTYTMMHSDPRTSSGLYSNLINFQANNNNGLSDHWGQSSGNPNSVMFGSSSTTNEGSHCSTSSDGSCNFQIKQEEIHGFLQHRQAPQTSFVGLLSNGNNYGGGYNGNSVAGDDSSKVNLMWGQKSTGGCFGLDDGHDYQYYYPSSSSPASTCVSEDQVNKQVNNNYFVSLFNVGENKTQENYNKVMYF